MAKLMKFLRKFYEWLFPARTRLSEVRRQPLAFDGDLTAIASRSVSQTFIGSSTGVIWIHDVDEESIKEVGSVKSYVRCADCDDQHVYIGCSSGDVFLLNIQSGILSCIASLKSPIVSLCCLGDCVTRRLVVLAKDCQMQVLTPASTQTGESLPWKPLYAEVREYATPTCIVSPINRSSFCVGVCSEDLQCTFFDAETFQVLFSVVDASHFPKCGCFLRTEQGLCCLLGYNGTAADGGFVRAVDMQTHKSSVALSGVCYMGVKAIYVARDVVLVFDTSQLFICTYQNVPPTLAIVQREHISKYVVGARVERVCMIGFGTGPENIVVCKILCTDGIYAALTIHFDIVNWREKPPSYKVEVQIAVHPSGHGDYEADLL